MRAGTWPSIVLIYAFSVIAGAAIGKMIPIMPDVVRATGTTLESAAWLISIISAASVLVAPFGGVLSDRFGDRKLIGAGLVIMVLANLGNFVAQDFTQFVVTRTVEGCGFICVALGATTMMVRTTSGPRQGIAMALMSTGVPLGVGLGLAAAGQLAGPGWRNVFVAHIALLGVMAVLLTLTPAWHRATARADDAQPSWWSVASASGPSMLALGIFISTIVMFGFGTLFPNYVVKSFGLTPAAAAAFGLLSYPASIIGSLAVGWFAARYGVRVLIAISLALLAASGVGIFVPSLGLNVDVLVLFVFYVVGGMVGAIGMSRLPDVMPSPSAMGITSSLFMQGANLGILVGAPITYFAYGHGQATGIAILTVACTGLNFVCWFFQPQIAGTADA
jgi:predicted MFS family arabinose efflux permease